MVSVFEAGAVIEPELISRQDKVLAVAGRAGICQSATMNAFSVFTSGTLLGFQLVVVFHAVVFAFACHVIVVAPQAASEKDDQSKVAKKLAVLRILNAE